jgi:hypothetical protein
VRQSHFIHVIRRRGDAKFQHLSAIGVVERDRQRARTRNQVDPVASVPRKTHERIICFLFLFIEAVSNSTPLLPSLEGVHVRISDECGCTWRCRYGGVAIGSSRYYRDLPWIVGSSPWGW